ncbi:MAG: hypothetical protein FWF32_02925 [Endomicrobia bacterium]|nr:hypothetical protein [Endomicrobiia bacterium]
MNHTEKTLKEIFKVSKLKDNTKGFLLSNGEYIDIKNNSHSTAAAELGLTLEELLLENILRIACYNGELEVEKAKDSEITAKQKTVIEEFVKSNKIKKIRYS